MSNPARFRQQQRFEQAQPSFASCKTCALECDKTADSPCISCVVDEDLPEWRAK